MRSLLLVGLFAALFIPTTSAVAVPDAVRVPRSKAPVVDGTLSPGEWDRARVEKLSNGGEVRLQHDGEYLYLGLRVPELGIGSFCVPDGSKGVLVLHASAALGTARYDAGSDGSQLSRKFVFDLRDTGRSPEALSKRASFLADEGWFANTSQEGSHEREYQIAWKMGDRRGLPLAVVYMTFPGEKIHAWPATLDDASVSKELVMGNLPERLRFDTGRWALVAPE